METLKKIFAQRNFCSRSLPINILTLHACVKDKCGLHVDRDVAKRARAALSLKLKTAVHSYFYQT